MLVITVSTASRLTRQRNTFGRTLILGFKVSRTTIASGRAPCAIPFPTLDGRFAAAIPGTKVMVLRSSSPHAALILRRTERSRACAGSSGTARGLRRSSVTDDIIGLRGPERPGHRYRRCAGTAAAGHCGLHRVTCIAGHLLLSSTEPLYESAERVVMIRGMPSRGRLGPDSSHNRRPPPLGMVMYQSHVVAVPMLVGSGSAVTRV